MKKTNLINFENVKETATNEKIIKQWNLENNVETSEDNKQEKLNVLNKIILTNKRLITISMEENDFFVKNTYKLEDIHSVNTCISQKRSSIGALKALAIFFLLISITLAVVGGAVHNTPIIIFGVCLFVAAIVCLCLNYSNVGILITLYLTNTKQVEFAESDAENKIDLTSKNRVKLKFEPSKQAIEMALELDNLILDAQSKLEKWTKKERFFNLSLHPSDAMLR